MALAQGQKLNPADIIAQYRSIVINKIKSGCYDITNPPVCSGLQAVPSSILGNLQTELYDGEVGLSKEKDTAKDNNLIDIYNSLLQVTKYLLRVGTFSYTVYMTRNVWAQGSGQSGNVYYSSMSGKAFFTQAYAQAPNGYTDSQNHRNDFANAPKDPLHPKGSYPNHLKSVADGGVLSTKIFSVQSITNLLNNYYNSWNGSGRPTYSSSGVICHYNCYSNCHSSCHSSCHGDCNSTYYCDCQGHCNVHGRPGCYDNA